MAKLFSDQDVKTTYFQVAPPVGLGFYDGEGPLTAEGVAYLDEHGIDLTCHVAEAEDSATD